MGVAGYAMPYSCPANQISPCTRQEIPALTIAGVIVGAVGLTAGIILLTRHDVLSLEVAPLAPPPAPAPVQTQAKLDAKRSAAEAPGLTVTLRY
jgi:hypothetical protein